MITLLEGLKLLIGETKLLLLVLQCAILPAELKVLQGLEFKLLLQLHHLVHQELGQPLMTLLHCRNKQTACPFRSPTELAQEENTNKFCFW